jgi:hypothetical protein
LSKRAKSPTAARNGHQASDDRVVDRLQGDVAIDLGELLAVEVELADQRFDAAPLVGRQVLPGEPASADTREEIGVRTGRHEVARQDRVHLVLHTRALLDEMRAPHDKPPQHPSAVISDPRPGQEIRCQQLGEDPGVDLVGLHLRLRDRPRLARVRYDDPAHERAQHRRDCIRVRRRLERDLVVGPKPGCPRTKLLRSHADAALVTTHAILDHRDLRERPMNVHPNRPHL